MLGLVLINVETTEANMKNLRFVVVMAAMSVFGVLLAGCHDDDKSGRRSGGGSGQGQELFNGRLSIPPGTTAQSTIVTAPGAGIIVTEIAVPEDGVSVTAWIEDADFPGSRFDEQTGPVLTLSVVTAAGEHWRTHVHNPNATLLHARTSMRFQP